MKSKFWAVGVACFLIFCAAPASALASSISGIVTGEGAPLEGVFVCVESIGGTSSAQCENTSAAGAYSIPAIVGGEYQVEFFSPYESNYLTSYWESTGVGNNPTTIELAEDEELPGIGGELPVGGEIRGKVSAVGGGPLERAHPCATSKAGLYCGSTDEEGNYVLHAVVPGNYILEFVGPSSGPEFLTRWWDDKANEGEADEITVVAGGVFTADAALEPVKGVIEGTLTLEGLSSYPDGEVCAFEAGEDEGAVECAEVTFNGHFAFGLESGDYVLLYKAPGYTTVYNGGVASFEEATPIPVTAGQVSPFSASIDLHKPPGISGTVVDVENNFPIETGEVCALVINEAPHCAPLEAGGAYKITVDPGSYTVKFRAAGYATQFWNGATAEFGATPVEVTDRLVTGVDAKLETAETISGQVIAAGSGEELFGVEVCATPSAGGSPQCGITHAEGLYRITGLSGKYVLSFATGGYVTQYWNGVESEAQATPITVGSESSARANASLVEAVSPTNITAPTVSGTGKVGQILSCSEGAWSGSPAVFTYKYTWLRGSQTINGAKASTYTLGSSDAGQTIKCSVTATNSAGTGTAVKSSNGIAVAALRRLTVSKAGNGSGSVTSAPAGINCGTTCNANFSQGETVALTATPGIHMEFTGWSGGCTGTGTCEVTLGGSNVTVTPTFAKVTHTVAVTVSGAGSVSAGSGAISACTASGGTCSGSYEEGTTVTLTATPAAHHQFTGWSGCTAEPGGACEVSVAAAESVTATFAPIIRHLTITGSGDGTGTVASTPAGIDCGTICTAAFEEGVTVTLTPTPAPHSEFTGWSGACTGTGTCEVTLGATDATVTATFAKVTHTVAVTVVGNGSVSAASGAISGCTASGGTCSSNYDEGTEVTLTATPDPHHQLAGWTGCTAETGGDCEVAVAAAESVTATFAPVVHGLTVTKAGDGSGTVTSTPAGIECGATCAASLEDGTAVTLTAVADPGSEFTGWSGACAGVGPCAITLGADATVVANFAKVKSDEGGGVPNDGGSGGGGSSSGSNPPASPAPTAPAPAPIAPKPIVKKPLQCKKGFHKAKHKGKVRCVKPKPKHKGGGKAKGRRA